MAAYDDKGFVVKQADSEAFTLDDLEDDDSFVAHTTAQLRLAAAFATDPSLLRNLLPEELKSGEGIAPGNFESPTIRGPENRWPIVEGSHADQGSYGPYASQEETGEDIRAVDEAAYVTDNGLDPVQEPERSAESLNYQDGQLGDAAAESLSCLSPASDAGPREGAHSKMPTTLADAVQQMRRNAELLQETEQRLEMLLSRQHALMQAERLLEEQKVIEVIRQPLGLHKQLPITAILLFRCCWEWGSFHNDQAPVLSQCLSTIQLQFDEKEVARRFKGAYGPLGTHLCYWLCTCAVLLQLIHRHVLPKSSSDSNAPRLKKAQAALSSLKGKLTSLTKKGADRAALSAAISASDNSFMRRSDSDASSLGGRGSVLWHTPVAELAWGLDLSLQRGYVVLRDSARRMCLPLISECIQLPMLMTQRSSSLGLDDDAAALALADGEGRLEAGRPWAALVAVLNETLLMATAACMPRFVMQALFTQLLGFIDAQIFNTLLLRPEFCTRSSVRYLLDGLHRVDKWYSSGVEEQTGNLYSSLKHSRQALGFLNHQNLGDLSCDDIRAMCADLNLQQLYRLATTFWDDEQQAASVSGEVLEEIKRVSNVVSNGGLIVTFLLDEDQGVPFVVNGMVTSEVLAAPPGESGVLPAMPVVPALVSDGCPSEVFGFLQKDWNPPAHT